MSLFKPPLTKSLKDNAKTSLRLAISPIFWTHMFSDVATHYSMTLAISLANDMILNSENVIITGFDKLQSQYEITRGITSVLIPPLFGVLMNTTSKLWNYTRYKGSHTDLQYSSFLFILQAAGFFLLAGSIYASNVWFFLMMPSIMASFMKCVFFTNINYCYPVQVRGMFITFSSVLSLSVLWTQGYIVKAVQNHNNLHVYFYSQLGLGIFMLLMMPIIFMRISRIEPGKIFIYLSNHLQKTLFCETSYRQKRD